MSQSELESANLSDIFANSEEEYSKCIVRLPTTLYNRLIELGNLRKRATIVHCGKNICSACIELELLLKIEIICDIQTTTAEFAIDLSRQ